jgi:hypothetical protein
MRISLLILPATPRTEIFNTVCATRCAAVVGDGVGWNQITSCLAADVVLFNSNFNRESFLSNVDAFVNQIPNCKPHNVRAQIEPRTRVLYFPMVLQLKEPSERAQRNVQGPLHVVWNHRWEA